MVLKTYFRCPACLPSLCKKSTILNILLNDSENLYRATSLNLRPSRTSKENGIRVLKEILYCISISYHLLQNTWNLGWDNYYTENLKNKKIQEQQKHHLFRYLAYNETYVHDENVSVLPSIWFVVWSKKG